jgi:hypothetical protein
MTDSRRFVAEFCEFSPNHLFGSIFERIARAHLLDMRGQDEEAGLGSPIAALDIRDLLVSALRHRPELISDVVAVARMRLDPASPLDEADMIVPAFASSLSRAVYQDDKSAGDHSKWNLLLHRRLPSGKLLAPAYRSRSPQASFF